MSSVCRPFGERYGDGFGVSYEGTHQIMWAQGIFRPRAVTTQWGIDFIGENILAPTVTIHYPTMAEFIDEVKKGYDYVGIAFVAPTLHKVGPMVAAVREHSPRSKVVLGGYGTALGEEIAHLGADHVCQGEGVAFMRELLGEPLDRPYVQPVITQTASLFSTPMGGRTGYVFAGLGCPNGCDFCATSAYFKREHIALLPTGQDILDAMLRLRKLHPNMVEYWINDEDFLLNETRGRQYLEAVRKSGLPPLALSIFGSVKALSQYTPAELVEMGIDWVWIGYEGHRAGYEKQQGQTYRKLFESLRSHGISVQASMIIGFDYQTPQIIREEFEELMSLRPTMCQYLIYGPAPMTPLLARMKQADRLRPEVFADYRKADGFTLGFHHPHIGPQEMSDIQRGLYREEYERLGPAVFRVVEAWITGHENLKNHPVERVRAKAVEYGKAAHRAQIVLPASTKWLSPAIGAEMIRLSERIERSTGPLTPAERVLSKAAPALMRYTDLKLRYDIGQQPNFTRRTFRMPDPVGPFGLPDLKTGLSRITRRVRRALSIGISGA
jgi:haloalkane dehalogenase